MRNDSPSDASIKTLAYFSWAVDMDPVALAYENETDLNRKSHLAQAYRDITGTDVETRLTILHD